MLYVFLKAHYLRCFIYISNKTIAFWVCLENLQKQTTSDILHYLLFWIIWVNVACLLIPRHALFDTTSGKQTASLIQVALIWMFTLHRSWHFTQFVSGLWRWSGHSVGVNDSGGSANTMPDVDAAYSMSLNDKTHGGGHIVGGHCCISSYAVGRFALIEKQTHMKCSYAIKPISWLTVGHNRLSLHGYFILRCSRAQLSVMRLIVTR